MSFYHPQMDGQTKVMNQTVEQYLWAFSYEKPTHWFTFLPWVEFHYNTSVHLALVFSPYQVMYVRSKQLLFSSILDFDE